MEYRRLRRPAAVASMAATALLLSACMDTSIGSWTPRHRIAAPNQRPVAEINAEACDYHLGSGDRVGAATYAIYRDQVTARAAAR